MQLSRTMKALFEAWRRALSRALRIGCASRARRVASTPRTRSSCRTWHDRVLPVLIATVRPSSLARLDDSHATAASVIAAALASGTLITGALLRTSGAAAPPWPHVAGFALWSAARLGVLLLLAPAGHVAPRRIAHAWAISLTPFALGVVPGLQPLAFVLSIAVAYRSLVAVGLPSREAMRLVAWSYGGQAAGSAASKLLTAALAA